MGGTNKYFSNRGTANTHVLATLLPGLLPGFFMFLIRLTESLGGYSWARFGLHPRDSYRLWGIFTFPFLHADFLHLASNLLPLVFLSTLLYSLLPLHFWKINGFVFILSGFWTWCLARPVTVIGASAWVYALLGLLWIAGFARLGRKAMVLTGGLAFLYAGMIEGLLPVREGISWEGHLMGFLSGALAAFVWRREIRQTAGETKPAFHPMPEEEPPYPYWLYPGAPVLDENRKIIPPQELIWENGRPRRVVPQPEQGENEQSPPPANESRSLSDGYWTWTITSLPGSQPGPQG